MPEVIVCRSAVSNKIRNAYLLACTFSMSRQQFTDLVDIDVLFRVGQAPLSSLPSSQIRRDELLNHAAGMLDAFIHVIATEHCEVVCKGADGAIHKGANAAGTGLRWKGTDFLFTPIEVQP